MYAMKCENVGHSKDPFLTQVSEFAVLFGNELDAEVVISICASATASSSYLSIITHLLHLMTFPFVGVIDGNGSIYRSNRDYKGISCL